MRGAVQLAERREEGMERWAAKGAKEEKPLPFNTVQTLCGPPQRHADPVRGTVTFQGMDEDTKA